VNSQLSKKKIIFAILTLALVFSCLRFIAFAGYTNVTVTEAKEMINSNPSLVILDVRNQSEYDSGHIRNARLIPLWNLNNSLNELNKNDTVLVYCKLGGRSARASEILVYNNFSYVYNMLGGITNWISAGYVVYVKYPSIQEIINNATEGDALYISSGIYYEHITVNKSLTLVGENKDTTIVNGTENGTVFHIKADNVSISDFTIRNSGCACASRCGILVEGYAKNVNITNNHIIQNGYGIRLNGTHNVIVAYNNMTENTFGIDIIQDSSKNSIFGNIITRNDNYGIYFAYSTNGNIVSGNTFLKNNIGIYLFIADNNMFFQNNFVNNTRQIISDNSANVWDNGLEGNFWSNYTGTDSNNDGIGDTPHILNSNNQDNYPLMGIFYSHGVPSSFGYGLAVTIVSNSTVSNFSVSRVIIHPMYLIANRATFNFNSGKGTAETRFIMFSIIGETGLGFCRMCIPKALMTPPYTITINNGPESPIYYNETVFDSGTHRWIYFTYLHSLTREVWIMGQTDATPPVIANVTQQPEKENIYPNNKVKVYANVTDAQSGVKQVILNYSNGNGTWIIASMTNLEGNIYNATIPQFPYNTNVTYIIKAIDNVDNGITTEEMGYVYQYRVIPEFPSIAMLPIIMILTIVAAALSKKKTLCTKRTHRFS